MGKTKQEHCYSDDVTCEGKMWIEFRILIIATLALMVAWAWHDFYKDAFKHLCEANGISGSQFWGAMLITLIFIAVVCWLIVSKRM